MSFDMRCPSIGSNKPSAQLHDQAFQFIAIHEASGKADSATGSRLRSHLMKKHHERRRQTQKEPPRVVKRSRMKGCTHIGVFAPLPEYEDRAISLISQEVAEGSFLPSLPSITTSNSIQAMTFRRPVLLPPGLENHLDLSSKAFLRGSALKCAECGKLELHYSAKKGQTESRPLALEISGHDPFNSFPIPITHRMHSMIHHFIFHVIAKTKPELGITRKEGVTAPLSFMHMPTLLECPGCIHSMVALSLYSVALLRLRVSSPSDWQADKDIKQLTTASTFHLLEGVRLLQQTIENPTAATSTAAIVCAAILGFFSASIDDKAHVPGHHRGLVKMVELRGGIDTLPRAVANQMCLADTWLAWYEKGRPQLPMYKSKFLVGGSKISSKDVMDSAMQTYLESSCCNLMNLSQSPFQNDKFEIFLSEELFPIACQLYALTSILGRSYQKPNKIGPIEREFFEDLFCEVQRMLVMFPHPGDFGVLLSTTYYRQNSWRVAAIIYCVCILRSWDVASLPARTIASELVEALRSSDIQSMWSDSPEVLVWMLVNGAIAAWDKLDRDWILQELRYGIGHLGLKSLEELEGLLKSLLYCESVSREDLHGIWDEV